MDKFEIELFAKFKVNGRLRPAGWTGIVTASVVKLMQREGAGKVLRRIPTDRKPEKAKTKPKPK